MAFSDEFFSVMETARAGLAGVSSEVLQDDFQKHARAWYRFVYHIARATNPLLKFCLVKLERHAADEFTESLRAYFRHSFDEELGHDTLFLRDLAKMGVSEASVHEELPPSALTAMVGSQYFVVEHYHPAVYLGYIGLLEGYPPQLEWMPELIERSGLPASAWSTYRLHAQIDVDHQRALQEMLDKVPDLPWLRRAIVANGIRSAEYCCQGLEALLAS